MLAWALDHPYFKLPPPKPTGREEFGADFLQEFIRRGEEGGAFFPDLAATASALTAASIAEAARANLEGFPPCDEVVEGGRGARNPVLMRMLQEQSGQAVAVSCTDDYGLPVEAKEAVAFAFLAKEAAKGRVNNLPAATGADRGVVMGKIVPGQGGKSRQKLRGV